MFDHCCRSIRIRMSTAIVYIYKIHLEKGVRSPGSLAPPEQYPHNLLLYVPAHRSIVIVCFYKLHGTRASATRQSTADVND